MRKEIAYILILVSFVSCSKDIGFDQPFEGSNTLGFTTKVLDTKGAVKDNFVFGDQFFVYGVNTGDDDFDLSSPNGLECVFSSEPSGGVTVVNYGKSEGGGDNWQYANPVVWLDGKSTFFAFSPVQSNGNDYGISNYLSNFSFSEVPGFDFTVKGGYDPLFATDDQIALSKVFNKSQVDLLVAYVANQVGGKPINLQFSHALSQITFSVRPMQSAGFLRINSVVLRNVDTKSRYKLGLGWSSMSRGRDFALNLNNDAVSMIPATPDKVYSINDGDQTLMMLPQLLTDVVLDIRYAYSVDGIVWPDYAQGKLLSVSLSTFSPSWVESRRYNYILNIDPSSVMTFDSGIDPRHVWTIDQWTD